MHVENKRLELPADVAVERLLHDGVRDLGGGVARGMLKLYLVTLTFFFTLMSTIFYII
jgi:hypothetical protein